MNKRIRKGSFDSSVERKSNENLCDLNFCIIDDDKIIVDKNIKQSGFLSISYNILKGFGKIIYTFFASICKISIIYFVWIFMHYTASHMYTKFCVPNSFYGFVMSPFLTSTPHCSGLRWIVFNGANTINSMWILIGTWFGTKILTQWNPNSNDFSQTYTNVNEGFTNYYTINQ